jgi:hypothetical protein
VEYKVAICQRRYVQDTNNNIVMKRVASVLLRYASCAVLLRYASCVMNKDEGKRLENERKKIRI